MTAQDQRYTRRLVYLALFIGSANLTHYAAGGWRIADIFAATVWFTFWAGYSIQAITVWMRSR